MIDYNDLKQCIESARLVTYATVNENGSPHGSPVVFIISDKLDRIYMGTHPDSQHGKNIQRTGQAFGTIYERTDGGISGLYLKVENFHIADGVELDESLIAHNKVRSKLGKASLPIEFYKSPNQQRMFIGDIVEISTNDVERDANGHVAKDIRVVVEPSDIAMSY